MSKSFFFLISLSSLLNLITSQSVINSSPQSAAISQTFQNSTCNSTYRCSSSGSGRDLTTTCTNHTMCPNSYSVRSCLSYVCFDCSSASISNKDFYSLNSRTDAFARCQAKTCQKCSEDYFSQAMNMNSVDSDYSFPSSMDGNTKPKDLSLYLSQAFDRTVKSAKRQYRRNTCIDPRVNEYFGETDVTSSDYQSSCKDLVTDFTQFYMPYQCNDWVCNFKGKCSSQANQDNRTVSVKCECNNGFSGRKCIYSDKNYSYALNWTISIGSWLEMITKNYTEKVRDEEVFYNLDDIVNSLLSFVKTVSPSDVNTVSRVFGSLMNVIYNAEVPDKKETTDSILLMIGYTFEDEEPLIGLDPAVLLSAFNAPNGTNTTGYGFYKDRVNALIDQVIGRNNSNLGGKSLRMLSEMSSLEGKRLLQTSSVSTNLNMNNPTVTIPRTLSALMPADTTFSLTFVRDPKYYMKENQVAIQSQIVTLKAYSANNTKVFYSFPSVAERVKMVIPWSRVPFTLNSGTYAQNCKVYKFDGMNWSLESTCNIDNASNKDNVVVNCGTFDTLGVSCSNSNSFTAPKKGSDSNSLGFAYVLYFFVLFIIFV